MAAAPVGSTARGGTVEQRDRKMCPLVVGRRELKVAGKTDAGAAVVERIIPVEERV